MSATDSLQQMLKQSPEFAASIVAFNWNPANYLHPSQRQQCLPDIPTTVWEQPHLSGRLSELLLARLGLREKSFIETSSDFWPIALLSTDRLQRLALHIGALMLGMRVRASLSRDHVLAWKKKLGEEAYRFAMNSAALLPAGKVPLVNSQDEEVGELGASLIMAALAKTPEAFQRRVVLKFSKQIVALDLDPDKAAQLMNMVARIVEGEWFSSFAAQRK